jgi:hypothetical protein
MEREMSDDEEEGMSAGKFGGHEQYFPIQSFLLFLIVLTLFASLETDSQDGMCRRSGDVANAA